MVPFKRKARATARKTGWKIGSQRKAGKYVIPINRSLIRNTDQRVRKLERMIETKEGCIQSDNDVPLYHNNVRIVQNSAGAEFNPLFSQQGVQDPMGPNDARRVGDKISIKGIMLKAFFENALGRSKVWFRVMVIKKAKGDTIDRTTLFKQDTDNKMLDQVNTERFTIVAQRTFTIEAANPMASSVAIGTSGLPVASGTAGGQASKVIKMWLPGKKFGRNGNVVYEDGSSQPKFYDYRICIVSYDWFGTLQDINAVGRINELFTKIYYKDA